MSIEEQLRQIAAETARPQKEREAALEKEIFDLVAKVAQKREERDAARDAIKRLANFQVVIRGDYQRPVCWVTRREQQPLLLRAGTRSEDVFECSQCGTFRLPTGV